jgi:hypothetical protein
LFADEGVLQAAAPTIKKNRVVRIGKNDVADFVISAIYINVGIGSGTIRETNVCGVFQIRSISPQKGNSRAGTRMKDGVSEIRVLIVADNESTRIALRIQRASVAVIAFCKTGAMKPSRHIRPGRLAEGERILGGEIRFGACLAE